MPYTSYSPTTLPPSLNFSEEEERVGAHWKENDSFKLQNKLSEERNEPEFTFYDGPPFATGLPHYGHILAGTIKDTVTRYAAMKGHVVERRAGWDCHGLPVEYEIDQRLKITHRQQVLDMGIENYNNECRSIVQRYTKEWESTVTRLGRWIDFENDYKTMQPEFMESVWWVFKELFNKGLVYQGYKVMPFSTTCGTPLSNFEAGLNYKEDTKDPAVVASMPLLEDPDTSFVVWTTTPWTLPSNLAVCVNDEFTYLQIKLVSNGKQYIIGESRLSQLFPEMNSKKWKKEKAKELYTVMKTFKGKELVGKHYKPLFDYFASDEGNSYWRVLSDPYVSDDAGTGIVHQAPAFGEDDYRVCIAHGVIRKGEEIPCPVDSNGLFTERVTHFAGRYVKESDDDICKMLKEQDRLVQKASITHSYPFCWRSDTPLIYKAVPSWFVRVEEIKERLLDNNSKTYWVPNNVKEGRFHNWLKEARDWSVSRNRFWGTPIPVWADEKCEEIVCVGSVAELAELSGVTVTDLHRETVDKIEIPSKKNPGTMLKRIDEVFDCWFESGSMPYAQKHYPFENKEKFTGGFPADFIAEGLDQTRGWFYTLMVLSTALFDKPAFKNLIVNGLVLAGDGKKMSKRLKNYPDPNLVIGKYGADALRMYLINSPVVRAEPLKFQEAGVYGVLKDVFLPLYNAFRFLMQNIDRWENDNKTNFLPSVTKAKSTTNPIDVWVSAATQSLIKYVREEMEGYRLYTVMPELVNFIDQLTNWYVRLNRDRLKGTAKNEDAETGLQVLYDCLLNVSILLGPFTPFLAEFFYQHLRKFQPSFAEAATGGTSNPVMAGKSDSVHFLKLPSYDETRLNDTAIGAMGVLQEVVELGRNARDKRNVSLKMPIKNISYVVNGVDSNVLNEVETNLKDYIMSELNVWSVELIPASRENEWVKISLLPDLKKLGKKLGKNMGKVKKALVDMSHEDAKAAISAGTASVEGFEIDFTSEVLSKMNFNREGDHWESATNASGTVVVAIDTTEDEALLSAGKARSFVSGYQKLRKSSGLQMGDPVETFYLNCEAEMDSILSTNASDIESTLKALPLPVSYANKSAAILGESEVVLAGGVTVTIQIRAPTVSLSDDHNEFVNQFMTSMSLSEVSKKDKITCEIDGNKYELVKGIDYFSSASEKVKTQKKIAWA